MILINDQPIFTEEYNLTEKQAQERRGFSYLKKLKVLIIGSGDTSFRADKNGIWCGAAKFADAPFSVTMAGIIVATGLIISGDAISGGTITGVAISGVTITGGTIRTSSGTTRVEMASDNTLTIYQDGNERVIIGEGAIVFLTPAGVGSGAILGIGTNKLVINTGAYGYYFDEAAFYPSAAGLDVGTSGERFDNVYANAYPASPIRVTKSGIESFKKIKGIKKNKRTYTLETKDLPSEFKIKGKKGKEHTELKKTVGLCVQTIMELIVEVDKLKNKVK